MPSEFIRSIERLVAERDAYCDQRGYSRQLTHPAGNWAVGAERNSIHDLFRQVMSGNQLVLENLRLYAQPFTGYDLNEMKVIEGRTKTPSNLQAGRELDPWPGRYYQIVEGLPEHLRFTLPRILGERGEVATHKHDGLINHDTYVYQERINLLYESGVLNWLKANQESLTIVEIGGGFGGLALALSNVLQVPVRYVILDLPESLLYAALYLSKALPNARHSFDLSEKGPGFVYVANYRFDEWIEENAKEVLLAVNTLSLVEMNRVQMDYYATRVRSILGNSGIFFEQNHDGRWVGGQESKRFLSNYFQFHQRLRPRTIPYLTNGRADLWSNVPPRFLRKYLPTIDLKPFKRLSNMCKDSFWARLAFLGVLQHSMPPRTFATLKRAWNKVGGRLPQ